MSLVGEHIKRIRKIERTYRETLKPNEGLLRPNWKVNSKKANSLTRSLLTCRGRTSVCSGVCWAARPDSPSAFDKSIKRQLRCDRFIETHPFPEAVAEILGYEYEINELNGEDPMRPCASGDLTPKLVDVLIAHAARFPDQVVWVSSRIPELILRLPRDAENYYLMYSFDSSPESIRRWAEVQAVGHPRVFGAFLLTDPRDNPAGARVVFPVRGIKGLPFLPGFTCPADAEGRSGSMEDACASCRRCFSTSALDGSRYSRSIPCRSHGMTF